MKLFRIQSKEEKQLDEIIGRLQMNLSNNYKDSAQAKLAVYAEKLKGYSHKDQKPYWH